MCNVTVNCRCGGGGGGGGGGLLIAGVVIAVGVVALPAIVAALASLVQSILILVGSVVGFVVLGALAKTVGEHALDELAVRRQLRLQQPPAAPPTRQRVQVDIVRPAQLPPPPGVRIYPTPREELQKR